MCRHIGLASARRGTPIASLWLSRGAGRAVGPARRSRARARADVAIAGGGFVGLWTRSGSRSTTRPATVVVLEQDVCGGGASPGAGQRRHGAELVAVALEPGEDLRLRREAVRLGPSVGRRGRRGGGSSPGRTGSTATTSARASCGTATAPAHVGVWDGVVRLCEAARRRRVRALEPRPRSRAAPARPSHLAVHPGARRGHRPAGAAGARPAARRARPRRAHPRSTRGVTGFSRQRPLAVRTERGTRSRREKLVVATNAWASCLPGLRRALVVVSSDIVADRADPRPPRADRMDRGR
jgi:hypothetical protein